MSAAIEVRELGRDFGTERAVDSLTFDVTEGEIFGIVGPDGAGKTTTMRMLSGVLRPTRGDARVLGIGVAREPEAVKAHIAYMAQRYGLYEDLTVAENIAFYADLYRVPKDERQARLERLYAFSGLGPFRDRLFGQLSGGMKQKASLCCALIHHPRLLLLDEPTFGVDPISRRDLWEILQEMAAGGVTIVLTTSYLDEAARCDRVAMLNHGRLIGLGSPQELQAAFPARLLAVTLGGDRELRRHVAALAGVLRVVPFGDEAHVTLEAGADEAAVRAALVAAGIGASDVRTIEPSLEDVFLERVTEVAGAVA